MLVSVCIGLVSNTWLRPCSFLFSCPFFFGDATSGPGICLSFSMFSRQGNRLLFVRLQVRPIVGCHRLSCMLRGCLLARSSIGGVLQFVALDDLVLVAKGELAEAVVRIFGPLLHCFLAACGLARFLFTQSPHADGSSCHLFLNGFRQAVLHEE